ncbi:MAG: hypothetical protein MMC33_004908 [Icmadophila ericetorum]|nr:hypothetical protein [Icmadophila ericetorum]
MATSGYDEPDRYEALNEVASVSPIQNPHEQSHYHRSYSEDKEGEAGNNGLDYYESLEERVEDNNRGRDRNGEGEADAELSEVAAPPPINRESTKASTVEEDNGTSPTESGSREKSEEPVSSAKPSRLLTELYTISYLIFFSFLGTLARIGLQTLTVYPGAPLQTGVLWANFAGSFVMGFLSEDRKLFGLREWDLDSLPAQEEDQTAQLKRKRLPDEERVATAKQHAKVKKAIPLYIGMATGFCGSFTSFSSFIRDVFLALSNNLPNPSTSTHLSHSGGYSFLALLAVILLTVCLSLSALIFGAHFALAVEPWTPVLTFSLTKRIIDPITVFLAFGCWLAATLIAIFPTVNAWRGEVIFALVFAPLGCLSRFYISIFLNARIPSFPLGTFTVNILGTLCLGMFYDLQHAPVGGVAGCQVLQGLMDGFCGCLTTVSTWVAELKGLRRRHAYIYGTASVVTGLCGLIVVMGGLRWTRGFVAPLCVT